MNTIGFIGSGNMAEALIKGIIAADVYRPEDVMIADVRSERLEQLASEYNVRPVESNPALAAGADVVVLSVKPQNMDAVLSEIKDSLKGDSLVVSIAAGITTAKIAGFLGDVPIVRVMPNTPALVGEGASALFAKNAGSEAMALVMKIFSAVGKAVVVDREELIDAVTAVSGSGPAYYFLLMEEMIKAGEQLGLDEATAKELVLQTAKGAALLAEQADGRGETPAELRRKVTSPGGTTEAALKVFAEKDFSDLVTTALTAARDRSRDLSG
ncbi:MAG TPA: pyrroline-5-carboxylate reductase [Planctomycetes bacterium]|nr:pyrroline-5-carboxylate reductase [Planctomycetota bacterium]HIJ70949.1 pyrroline-5-carboxylate reductase [Planctomycetota bacterium]